MALLLQIIQRIHRIAVGIDPEVQMGAGAAARVSHESDQLPLSYRIAFGNEDAAAVGVAGLQAVAMVDDKGFAVTFRAAHFDDRSGGCGFD